MDKAKDFFIFVMHQFIGTWGVAIIVPFMVAESFAMLQPISPRLFNSHEVHWVATELPYFPMQIVVGLWVGWSLGRRLNHRSMLWVWVLPLLILCFAVAALPTLTPDQLSLSLQAGVVNLGSLIISARDTVPRISA
jgi:hypothetical protein